MNRLVLRHKNFKDSYDKLIHMIAFSEDPERLAAYPCLYQIRPASIAKFFEMAHERAFKFLKNYLETVYEIDAFSQKMIIQECSTRGIFSEEVTRELEKLVALHNQIPEMYNEIIAEEVYATITKHHQVLGKILELVKIPEKK